MQHNKSLLEFYLDDIDQVEEVEETLDEGKKKKKPYSSMSITTGNIEHNIRQFNKHMGTDFPGNDNNNPSTAEAIAAAQAANSAVADGAGDADCSGECAGGDAASASGDGGAMGESLNEGKFTGKTVKLVNSPDGKINPGEEFNLTDLKCLLKSCDITYKQHTLTEINLIVKFDNKGKVLEETEKGYLVSIPCYFRKKDDRSQINPTPVLFLVWAPKKDCVELTEENLELDEAQVYSHREESWFELPPQITLLDQKVVEDFITQLAPEEKFQVGYVNPVYFYAELDKLFTLIKATELLGYTGIDYRDATGDSAVSDHDARITNAQRQMDTYQNGAEGHKLNRDGEKFSAKYSQTNKLTLNQQKANSYDEIETDDAGNETVKTVNLNKILFYPIVGTHPVVKYFLDLNDGKGFRQVPRELLVNVLYKKIEDIAASRDNGFSEADAKYLKKLGMDWKEFKARYGNMSVDTYKQAIKLGEDPVEFYKKHPFSRRWAVSDFTRKVQKMLEQDAATITAIPFEATKGFSRDFKIESKPQVRALYTNQVYFISGAPGNFGKILPEGLNMQNKEQLTEAKRYVRRYFIRPQQIFCSNKSEILKSLIEIGNENCSVYTLNNLGDIKDTTKLTNNDIIYYYDDGILYDKNHVKVMDYDLSIKHEEDRKKFSGKPTSSQLASDEYEDRMTSETVTEDLEYDKDNQFKFTPEEQEEYNCDEDGNSYDSYDQYVHCGWCGEIYTTSECREEATFGYICPRCEDELHYHGGELMFIESKEKVNEYYDGKQEVESDQELHGMDNAVVDCQTDFKVIAHSEDEKPLDCKMKKAPLEKPLTEEYKIGDKVRIIHLNGEDNRYDGKEGEITDIDGIGQLHGTWGGLAIIPELDDFEIINEDLTEAKKDEDELPPDPEVVKLNVHSLLNNMVSDTISSINDKEDAKLEIADAHIEHKDDIIATINEIENDEKEHIDELIDAAADIAFDGSFVEKPSVKEEPVEEPIEEPEKEENDNPFDQEFESYNAYGEKLTEGKDDKFTCCICGEECYGYGNNPAPVKEEGRCCDSCNIHFVIPARLEQMKDNKNE